MSKEFINHCPLALRIVFRNEINRVVSGDGCHDVNYYFRVLSSVEIEDYTMILGPVTGTYLINRDMVTNDIKIYHLPLKWNRLHFKLHLALSCILVNVMPHSEE